MGEFTAVSDNHLEILWTPERGVNANSTGKRKFRRASTPLALLIIASSLTNTYAFLSENIPELVSDFADIYLSLCFGSLWWSLFKAAVILWIIIIFIGVVAKLRKIRK